MTKISKNEEKYNIEINNIIEKFKRAINKLEKETKIRTNGIYMNILSDKSWNISVYTKEEQRGNFLINFYFT